MTVRQPTDSEAFVAVLAGDAKASAQHPEHPEIDQLLDYHSGQLSSEVAAGVLDHLVSCRRCTQTLLDLEAFPDTAAPPSNVVSMAAVAGWRDFKSRMAEPQRPAAPPRRTPLRALYSLAASLLLGVVGLSFWVADLRQTVAVAHMPQTNPPFFTLAPTTRGEDSDWALIEVPRERPIFQVRVFLGTLEVFTTVEAELVDAKGRTVWSDDNVEVTDSGDFRVSLSRRWLPMGNYRIRVDGVDGDHREILVDRELRIRYP